MPATASPMIDVLLVEDDPGEALLVQDALTDSGANTVRCHLAPDGDSAARFLWRQDEFTAAPRPRLILLDLHLGATHGLQLLARLKADDELKIIPVVVLSSSRHPADIHRSYAQHASAYIVKPMELDHLGHVIDIIDACFLRLAESAIACQHAGTNHYPVPGI